MDAIIEDGYNTSYISILCFVLFFEKSMIERYLLMENFSRSHIGSLLQKIIQINFVEPIRNNICITSRALNEIRLHLFMLGMKKFDNIDEFFIEYSPIELLSFMCKIINFVPIEYECNGKYMKSCYLEIPEHDVNMQTTYDLWRENNIISNVAPPPPFIIFKISNIKKKFDITKKIKLFPTNSHYNNIIWSFHGLFYKHKTKYIAITNKNNSLYSFETQKFPCIQPFKETQIKNLQNKDIFIIYHKNPSV